MRPDSHIHDIFDIWFLIAIEITLLIYLQALEIGVHLTD